MWRDVVGDVLRRERVAQERTLKDVAEAARISMPYLSELERGRKEASSEVLAAAGRALGLGLADLLGLARAELIRLGRPDRAASMIRVPSGADIPARGLAAVPADNGNTGTVDHGAVLPSVTALRPSRVGAPAPVRRPEVRLAA